MLESAVLVDTVVVDAPSSRMDKTATFIHHMYCPVTVNGEKGIAKLYITENIGDEHKFYLTKIEMESTDSVGANVHMSSADSTISIAEIFEFVKANNEKFEKNSEKPTKFEPRPVNEHDAVVFRNAKDSADGTGKAADVYVFMKPEMQLKSATDNIGTFDRGSKDIRYSIAPISPREMLHNEIAGLSDEEIKKRGLLTYRRNIDKYNDLRRQREEILDSINFGGRM